MADYDSRRANRYTTRHPKHWWQTMTVDVLTVTPRVTPDYDSRRANRYTTRHPSVTAPSPVYVEGYIHFCYNWRSHSLPLYSH